MTFPTTSESTALAQNQNSSSTISKAFLSQSRESGGIASTTGQNDSLIIKQKALVVKPWAHFVAGA